MMNERKTTNILLLIIALPVVFYILKILSFIFIPLIFAMFIALLFLPVMRWLDKRKVPKTISLILVIIFIIFFFKLFGETTRFAGKEIIASGNDIFEKAELKLEKLIPPVEAFFGIERMEGKSIAMYYLKKIDFGKNFGATIDFVGNIVSMTLMTVFFTILLLAESLNFQKILNTTIIRRKFSSIKVFMRIEKDLITFIKVKFFISFLTGLGFSLACYFFDVSFPVFWGLLAFSVNFIQMIGSVVAVILLSIFGFVELDATSSLFFFILVISSVQILMGSILEPVLMGKSFSVNIITILVMLMFWGFLWGIAGLILAVPVTVFIKIILEQFSSTKIIADLMSGGKKAKLK